MKQLTTLLNLLPHFISDKKGNDSDEHLNKWRHFCNRLSPEIAFWVTCVFAVVRDRLATPRARRNRWGCSNFWIIEQNEEPASQNDIGQDVQCMRTCACFALKASAQLTTSSEGAIQVGILVGQKEDY